MTAPRSPSPDYRTSERSQVWWIRPVSAVPRRRAMKQRNEPPWTRVSRTSDLRLSALERPSAKGETQTHRPRDAGPARVTDRLPCLVRALTRCVALVPLARPPARREGPQCGSRTARPGEVVVPGVLFASSCDSRLRGHSSHSFVPDASTASISGKRPSVRLPRPAGSENPDMSRNPVQVANFTPPPVPSTGGDIGNAREANAPSPFIDHRPCAHRIRELRQHRSTRRGVPRHASVLTATAHLVTRVWLLKG